ncbi:WXG100 family type VII secretion target [Oribacterium sp. KHPX15]|uniref:WXG100 family type VII secretion target n=1 Tax=unclassified Oribacterium TaxID=2629782 RepID=UPI0004E1A643|nr:MULTISPECIES: WXG100 family type VII secretion target [unclassified Oribacterium]SDZ97443.1 WXG100 family type VII secretion target [Oribacterium sp. KHPX15]
MASKHKIKMDFREARKQADELDEIADNLHNVAERDLEQAMTTLSSGWKGESASAYLVKVNKVKEKTNREVQDLHSIASDIRRTARIIYEAEMEAWRIAHERD